MSPYTLADFAARLASVSEELNALMGELPHVTPRLNLGPCSRELQKAATILAGEVSALAAASDIIAADAPLSRWLPDSDETWYARSVPSPKQLALLARTAETHDGRGTTVRFSEAAALSKHLVSPTLVLPDLSELARRGESEPLWFLAESTEGEWREAYELSRRHELGLLKTSLNDFFATVYSVNCSYCGAVADQLCRTKSGWATSAHQPHRDRRVVAVDVLTATERAKAASSEESG